MSTIAAVRSENKVHEGRIQYKFTGSGDGSATGQDFIIQENTNLVDGIGGVTWDGALILCKVLENIGRSARESSRTSNPLHLVDLGCGTGLCGIVAAKMGMTSTLSDRCADLARLNVENAFPEEMNSDVTGAHNIKVYAMPWESSTERSNADVIITDEDHITAVDLVSLRGKVDIIVGAEITCLRKQQGLLTDTIVQLCESNNEAIILLSFDGTPPPNDCLYEKDMISRMTAKGFQHSTVCAAECEWLGQTISNAERDTGFTKVSTALIDDHTWRYPGARNRVSFPTCHLPDTTKSHIAESKRNHNATTPGNKDNKGDADHKSSFKRCSEGVPPLPQVEANKAEAKALPPSSDVAKETSTVQARASTSEKTEHHIIAFYRPAAVNTCRTCQQQYFRLPGLNSPQACRHHAGLYVCRRHPGETKCSINGLGDGLGYYGNGQDHWKAEFWDCCGSEDPAAEGCCTSRHVPY